jgi:hypothetical protein
MSWQIFLLINLISATVRETLNKKIADKLSPFVGLFYISLFAEVFFLLYQGIVVKAPIKLHLEAMSTGIIIVIAFAAYFKALRISLSQSILFQSYSILVTIILSAIFAGELSYFNPMTSSGQKIIGGIVLAFISLNILLHGKSKKDEKLEKRWFMYIIVTILFLGVGSFVSIYLSRLLSPSEVFINQEIVMIPSYLILSLLNKDKLAIDSSLFGVTLVNAFISSIAVIAFYLGILQTKVAIFFPIQQLSLVVLTMISGALFFKETQLFSGKKLFGMVVGFLGMILLTIS